MTDPRSDPDGPRPAHRADVEPAPPFAAVEPSGPEEPAGLIDRFAWLALLPWGCSVSIVVALFLGATLTGWSSR